MIVAGPLLSIAAHGKIAKSLQFRKTKNYQAALKNHKPKNRKSLSQQNIRRIFNIGVRLAKDLSEADKKELIIQDNSFKNNPANNIFLTLFLDQCKYSF